MNNTRQQRLMEVFYRVLRGEAISPKKLADHYNVSTKSISRTIGDLKIFLAESRNLIGEFELVYNNADKCYRLNFNDILTNMELFAIIKILLGTRALSQDELLLLITKLKRITSQEDRKRLEDLIRNEIYSYKEIKHDCESVEKNLWELGCCIKNKSEISIEYYRMDRQWKIYRLKPVSVMFSDHYFYLIAFKIGEYEHPFYFRVDRIKNLTIHRIKSDNVAAPQFDEGLLRQRSLFMWPGILRTVRFEFSGPSVQAVLDKLPTAHIIEYFGGGRYLIEAETYGDGIKMWLLSQGDWVKVVYPAEFVKEIKETIQGMNEKYNY